MNTIISEEDNTYMVFGMHTVVGGIECLGNMNRRKHIGCLGGYLNEIGCEDWLVFVRLMTVVSGGFFFIS